MNRATALCLAACCLLSAGPAVHADAISSSNTISDNFSPGSPQISFNNGTLNAIRLLNTSGSMPVSTSPTAIHTDFAAFSFGAGTVSTPVNLTLSDPVTHASGTVSVGTLSGLVWKGGSAISFTSINGGTNPVTTNFEGHTFTISYSSLQQVPFLGLTAGRLTFSIVDPPGGNGNGNGNGGIGNGGIGNGGIGNGIGHISAASTPEPSSLVLAGIGIPLIGIVYRRRRAARRCS